MSSRPKPKPKLRQPTIVATPVAEPTIVAELPATKALVDDRSAFHLVAGPTFRGVQFHAESILTENGFALLRELLLELLG